MTIETGPAQNASRPAATESKHVKGKLDNAPGHGAGGAAGFMAVLASLDASELGMPASGLADVALPGNGPASTTLVQLAQTAGKLKGIYQPGDALEDLDPSAALNDLSKLLPTSATDLAAMLPSSGDSNLMPNVLTDTSALLAQAAQWATSAVAAAVATVNPEQTSSNEASGVDANLGGATTLPHAPVKSDGADFAGAATAEAGAGPVGKGGKAQKDALAQLASAQAAQPAMTSPVDGSRPVADARQTQWLQKVMDAPLATVASTLAAASTVAPSLRDESMRERSVFRVSASDNTSSISQSAYMPSASGSSAPSAPAPVTSTDTYIAEKVAYWISNDVQNAEMTLDGIGDKPVEVSIRMQGNEAHIAFRSDELQARAALENASVHLRDMLQREGLVLSGVSVGTAGAGASGEQGGKSRQGARQSGVASVQPARVDRLPSPGRVSGGALDLFV